MDALRIASRASMRQLLRSQAMRQWPGTQLSRTPPLQTHSTFRTRPNTASPMRCLQLTPKRPLTSRFRIDRTRFGRRWKSSDAAIESKPDSQLTMGQRLKKLSREYGWAALYVYLGLTALDFPFCFLAVKLLGTEVIGHWEHVIVSNVKALLQWPLSGTMQQQVGEAIDKAADAVDAIDGKDGQRLLEEKGQTYIVEEHGFKEAQKANEGKDASIWTQLALAYAIHKSFIFVRIPLTAAILPKIVKTLRGWGWNIGRPTRKALKEIPSSGKVGVNTKGSKVKPDD